LGLIESNYEKLQCVLRNWSKQCNTWNW